MNGDRSGDNIESARLAYEHLRSTYADDLASQASYVESVNRLLTIHTILFASLSYASTEADWALHTPVWYYTLLGLSAIAAISSAVAFGCGIRGIGIKRWSAVGTISLAERVRAKDVRRVAELSVIEDLSINLINVINENRARMQSRQRLSNWLNGGTLLGFCFSVAFVALALFGKVFLITPK